MPTSASVSVETHRGIIHVAWSAHLQSSNLLNLNVTVPPGSRGEIHVPKDAGSQIVESGHVLWDHGSPTATVEATRSSNVGTPVFKSSDDTFVVFSTVSGEYYFEVVSV